MQSRPVVLCCPELSTADNTLPLDGRRSDVTFGNELRKARQANGLSLRALANRVRYDYSYLSRIENGERRPPVELARLLDESLDTAGLFSNLLAETAGEIEHVHLGGSFHTWAAARTRADLCDVVALSRQVIGGQAGFKAAGGAAPDEADVAPLRRLIDRRPDAVQMCLREDLLNSRQQYLVGYLLLYPLTEAGTDAVLSGRATSADQFDQSGVCGAAAEEVSLYLGMVLGVDVAARASVMERCVRRVSRWADEHSGGYIFAKRSTADGQRWLEGYGFVPVTTRDGIWLRDGAASRRWQRRRLHENTNNRVPLP